MSSHEDKWNGRALKVRRVARGWKLTDLQARLVTQHIRVDVTTIQRWEGGRKSKNHRNLARALGRIFGCSALAFYRDPIVTFENPDDQEE